MIRSKLIYAVTVILLAAFSILYLDSLALVMLCAILLLPFFMAALLLWSSYKISIKLKISDVSGVRKKEIPYEIILKKPHKLPVSYKTEIYIKNQFTGEVLTKKIRGCFYGKKQCLQGKLSCSSCGELEVNLKKSYTYDFLLMFRKKIKGSEKSSFIIFPDFQEIEGTLATMPATDEESNLYSKLQAGNDSSEIFDIREFRDGDSPRRIHWNLSSKTDDYMVKEYGLPLKNSIMILVELDASRGVLQDSILDLLLSLSGFLLEKGVGHGICRYSEENGLNFYDINQMDELYEALADILSMPCVSANKLNNSPALKEYLHSGQNSHTHLIYLTSDRNICNNELVRGQSIPVTVMTVVKEKVKENIEEDDFRCIFVKSGEISVSLTGLEL